MKSEVKIFSAFGLFALALLILTTCAGLRTNSIPPKNIELPAITGSLVQGATITGNDGNWTGTPPPTYSWQWYRNGVAILGANQKTYTLQSQDVGAILTFSVTATNKAGTASATSMPSNLVVSTNAPPVNLTLPLITGTPAVGSTLSSSNGTWSGYPIPTFSYQWLRLGSPIAGAISNTYTITSVDTTATLSIQVTATNSLGSASAQALPTTVVSGLPINTIAPYITGTATVNQTLTSQNGTWLSEPAATFTYQWQRLGIDIAGATGSTYVCQVADIGYQLTVRVIATNSVGSIFAVSTPTQNVTGIVPSNTLLPAISGTLRFPQTLSLNDGNWTGSPTPTFTRQWKRNGLDIASATNPTYTITQQDIGWTLTAQVNATNPQGGWAGGSVNASSPATTTIQGIDPVNTALPNISGTVSVGQVLTANDGTWTATPAPTFSYQWKRNGTNITGATSKTYTLVDADFGATMQVTVTASNSQAAWTGIPGTATSTATSAVLGSVPVNTVLPVLSANRVVNQVISVDNGTWTGTPPITFSFSWFRNGVAIAGENANTYTLTITDIGNSISAQVTATNASGSSTATTAASSTINGISPTNTVIPSITGATTEGSTLTANDGTWSGTPTPTLTREWKKNGIPIPGATGTVYILSSDDIGSSIAVTVTATNSLGSWTCVQSSATSASTPTVSGVIPTKLTSPILSNERIVNQTISTTNGTWSGSLPMTFSYEWLRNGTIISGENSNTYVLRSADVGMTIASRVWATNATGTRSSFSLPSTNIQGIAPVNTTLPQATGTAAAGQILTSTDGVWTGTPIAITFTRQWKRNGVPISGQTGSTYNVTASDSGTTITVTVFANNSVLGWTITPVEATSPGRSVP